MPPPPIKGCSQTEGLGARTKVVPKADATRYLMMKMVMVPVISTRLTLEVLFLDVDQDKAILCLIYRRCLWYQLYVPGHFNQLRFNPKVAS